MRAGWCRRTSNSARCKCAVCSNRFYERPPPIRKGPCRRLGREQEMFGEQIAELPTAPHRLSTLRASPTSTGEIPAVLVPLPAFRAPRSNSPSRNLHVKTDIIKRGLPYFSSRSSPCSESARHSRRGAAYQTAVVWAPCSAGVGPGRGCGRD